MIAVHIFSGKKTFGRATQDWLSVCRHMPGIAALCLWCSVAFAQTCPPNIDFESGNLDGWRCYTGFVSALGNVNTFNLTESGQVTGRHTIIPAAGALPDPYGGFSTASPNGSAYCVKLGNDMGGGEGEAISYEFTIPANRPTYSLLYYYAVVFQDPNHEIYQQPRMEIEITNLSDNKSIECASFAFVPFGSPLPGFFESNVQTGNAPVWCKDWTPVSINLDGNAGKAIRLTFRTGDCTFRRHFGYAYIDVDSDCSGELTGSSYCPLDSEVTVSAPFGFQSYTWFNGNMTQRVGTGQTLTLRPPPPAGTTYNVQLTPYDGYGCPQTLSVKFNPTLNFKADAGRDTLSCNLAPVRIGSSPRLGLDYTWEPDVGLSNPRTGNPIAIPPVTTDYVLTVKSPGGGCVDTDTVRVTASNLGSTMQVLGKPQYCIGSGDSAVLLVGTAETIQWFKNGQVLPNEKTIRYRVTETGVYSAYLRDEFGCTATTPNQSINISSIPVASFATPNVVQCFVNNAFVFTNSSTNDVGAMRYRWDFGGLGTSTLRDVNFSFPRSGQYLVKLVVNSNDVCADSTTAQVTIFPNPVPQFDATATCIGLPFVPVNTTNENIGSPVRYTWKYGNETVSTNRSPAPKVFASPGSVSVTLSVSSEQCPTPLQTLTKTLRVETPAPARRYTAAFAVKDVPLNLEARKIGVSAQWQPAMQLSNPGVYNPVFKGGDEQDYTITLTTAGGCTTVDSLLVQIIQKSNIQVPTAFTPNGDGLNDYLRPVPMDVAEIRYFRVFNRYGEVVYESRNGRPAWDGTHRGIPQTSQTVVWMVEGVGLDGSVITKRGTSVLVR